jgi:hypothetical protein
MFRFDKFSSFLRGTFGAPHLVIKKRKERNNKGKSKGMVQNHKKKQKKESERRQSEIGAPHILTSIFGAPRLSNSAPLIFGKQDHPILCAIFSNQGFGAPSPPLHTYLPRPLCLFSVWFHLVPAAFSTCLHPYSTLHLLIDCANPCSKVKPSYSSTNTYSVQVVSSGNRSIQASLVALLVAGHPCWRGKNE